MTNDTTSTAERLLDVAETMFTEKGYNAVSMRSISRACEANIAAIHYHFGSKDDLLDAIFARRAGAMNEARLLLLESCVEATGRPPLLNQVIEAYLRPSLLPIGGDARRFARLRAVIASEQAEISQSLIAKYFNEVTRRFINRIISLSTHLSADEVYWRFHFLLGAQYYTLSNPERIRAVANVLVENSASADILAEMVTFVGAGFAAPSVNPHHLAFGKIAQP